MLVNILGITDDAKCYEMVRHLRWPDGVRCPRCDAAQVVKQGRDDTEPHRQRYECRSCGRRFDDLTDTIFAGHHQAATSLGPGPLLHGPEPLQRADRQGT